MVAKLPVFGRDNHGFGYGVGLQPASWKPTSSAERIFPLLVRFALEWQRADHARLYLTSGMLRGFVTIPLVGVNRRRCLVLSPGADWPWDCSSRHGKDSMSGEL